MKDAFRILISLISISGFSQITPYEQKLYDKATATMSSLHYADIDSGLNSNNPNVAKFAVEINTKIINRTLEIYQELLDTLPNTKLRNRIDYDKAQIHYQNGNSKLAKEYYIKVLNDPQNIKFDFEEEENYARNIICRTVAKILIEEKDFKTALKYLDESEKFTVKYSCGNSVVEKSQELEKLYSICQAGLKK